jgi:hypothetical protein
LVAGILALATPGATLACLPYTLSDEEDAFGLAKGIQWAAAGEVVEERSNPEVPDRPRSVVIAIRETITGPTFLTRLEILQDGGCDGFWYRTGDRVIAAIGSLPGIRPPFTGITNYGIAVWVVRNGVVDATIRVPLITGRSPTTERQVRSMLGELPDTATAGVGADAESLSRSPGPLFVVLAGVLTALLAIRGLAPRLGPGTPPADDEVRA